MQSVLRDKRESDFFWQMNNVFNGAYVNRIFVTLIGETLVIYFCTTICIYVVRRAKHTWLRDGTVRAINNWQKNKMYVWKKGGIYSFIYTREHLARIKTSHLITRHGELPIYPLPHTHTHINTIRLHFIYKTWDTHTHTILFLFFCIIFLLTSRETQFLMLPVLLAIYWVISSRNQITQLNN